MPGVVFAFMYPETTSGFFTASLAAMLTFDAKHGRHVIDHGGTIALSSGPRVAETRCLMVDLFATKYPDSEWLLMIDSDMTFPEDIVEALMHVADPVEAPIVGGLCFAGGKQSAPYPTVYRLTTLETGQLGVERVYDYPRDAMVKVGATGGACLLMHRSVFAAMKTKFGELPSGEPNPYPWFQEGIIGPHGEAWGEDILFCLRAHQLGIPVHVHTGIKLGHAKVQIIDETLYDRGRNLPQSTSDSVTVRPPAENRAARRERARRLAKVKGSPDGLEHVK